MNKPIIISDIEQGTEEWQELRKGIPTASNFSNIITSTGKPSKTAKTYLYKLVAESIIGVQEGYTNEAMQQGIETEELARIEYEMDTGFEVEQVGFVYLDDKKEVGCSPDGLISVNGHGGVEIKCPQPHTHVSYLLDNKLPTNYIAQVQGAMYVAGRSWWDFFSYCDGLPNFRVRVQRDSLFIEQLSTMLEIFVADLKAVKKHLTEGKYKRCIVELKEKRSVSNSQNAYLHLILSWFGLETGLTLNEAKQLYKIINCDIYEYSKDNNVFYKSVNELDTNEMTQTIEMFRNYSAEEADVYLPEPDDRRFLQEIEVRASQDKMYLRSGQ
ncbi:MAG TPA: hypothetical protein ENH82_12400 [bacterium]|nr:hypothetical protein [bacterium]